MCGDSADLLGGYVPTFRSGDMLPAAGTFRLALKPGTQVRFFVGSTRALGDEDGYGGWVMFPRLPAGRYRIRVSQPAPLELMQNYRRLMIAGSPTEAPGAEAVLDHGAVVLQIRGAMFADVAISMAMVQACP